MATPGEPGTCFTGREKTGGRSAMSCAPLTMGERWPQSLAPRRAGARATLRRKEDMADGWLDSGPLTTLLVSVTIGAAKLA